MPVELQIPVEAADVRGLSTSELILHGFVVDDVNHRCDDV